jgi:hypothetical protein
MKCDICGNIIDVEKCEDDIYRCESCYYDADIGCPEWDRYIESLSRLSRVFDMFDDLVVKNPIGLDHQ